MSAAAGTRASDWLESAPDPSVCRAAGALVVFTPLAIASAPDRHMVVSPTCTICREYGTGRRAQTGGYERPTV